MFGGRYPYRPVGVCPTRRRTTGAPAVTVTRTDGESCERTETRAYTLRANVDPVQSNLDTFDDDFGWTADAPWTRTDGAWIADTSAASVIDSRLVSPPVVLGETPQLRFVHPYDLGSARCVDGGIIEIRVDGGDWQRISSPYDDPISTRDNPMNGTYAFCRNNPSWPEPDEVLVDLASVYAGRNVEIAFRVATDDDAGGTGWTLHEVEVLGGVEPAFSLYPADVTECVVVEEEEPSGYFRGGQCDSAGAAGPGAWVAVLALALGRRRVCHTTPS